MVHINLSYDLNVTLEQRIGFELAASIYALLFTDDTTLNFHISATDELDNNQAVGGAVPIFHEVNYGVLQEYMALDASSAQDHSVLDALQMGNTVDFYLDGELVDGNTTVMVTRAQAKALGMEEALLLEDGSTWDRDVIQDPTALDGYIVVNNSYDWNYDFKREAVAPEGSLDFLTMALHELGHGLGFVSGLDGLMETFEMHSGEMRTEGATILDLLRYSETSATIENPDGSVSDLTFGGSAYFSLDGGTTALAEFEEGNEYQASHWQRFQQALGIMDPTLGYQERTDLSYLDLQAFDVMGWNVDYAAYDAGLDLNALYGQAIEAISQDFQIGVDAVETAMANGQDWYTLGYGSWWQAFQDQMIELGYSRWWQEFEDQMAELGYSRWWQAFDNQMSELGYSRWWQAFEEQVISLGQEQEEWLGTFETNMLDLGYSRWWQAFEPEMLKVSYGSWWHIFEQQMMTLGYSRWWQEFEANLLEQGYDSWWQAFEADILEQGHGSWWQIFENKALELGYSRWWQEFEENMSELGYSRWWQAFELGYSRWWQEVEQQTAHLKEIEAATTTSIGTDGTLVATVQGSLGDDILAGYHQSRDLISGDAGYDLIDGKGGDDILLGGAGDDLVYGADGHDELHGGTGDDFLAGENDDDQLYGEEGHDILAGGRGNDILEGGEGRDVLKGDTGHDVLDGGADVDELAGGSGDDIVIGGDGQDVGSGGTGDDQLYGDTYNPDLVHYAVNAPDSSTTAASSSTTNDVVFSSQELLYTLVDAETSNLLDFWMRLEAEDLKLKKYNADEQMDASQGGVISANGTAKAKTKFSGPDGTYRLVVGYYDDNANTSEATLKINGSDPQAYSWLLDQGSGNASMSNNFFTYVIEGVNLAPGDKIELVGTGVGNEQVRIDYIDVIAVNAESQLASDGRDRLLNSYFYNGNFYAVASDSATATTEATERGGRLITPDADSQLAIWLENTLGTTANIIEIQGDTTALNLVGNGKLNQQEHQRIEAESFTFGSKGYRIAGEHEYEASLSEDKLLVATNYVGKNKIEDLTAEITIETSGIYNLYATYWDGNYGTAEATVLVNGTNLHSWHFNQDDNAMHQRVLGLDVLLEAGDVLQLESFGDGADAGAIDYFTLEKVTTDESFFEQDGSLATVRFEAEDMDFSAGNTAYARSESSASGNTVVYTTNTTDGLIATTEFTGTTGLYSVVVGYFDDDGGEATYSASLAGKTLDSWQANLELEDSNTGTENFVARTVATGIVVHAGDSITLQSIRDSYDYAYVDYVEFVPYDPTAAIRVEAEYMTLRGSSDLYDDSDIEYVASTGRAIRSKSSSTSNRVEGVTPFTGITGVYDIEVAYFDENDGEAEFSLSQGGTQLDRWIADQNFGSRYINSTTYTTRTIPQVALTQGEEIRFTSLRDGYDYGALDYIEFRLFDPNATDASTTLQLEVEQMDLSGDVDIDFGTFASENRFAKVGAYDGDDDDDDDDDERSVSNSGRFRATSLFSGESGYYDVVIGYYDENDGAAELVVNIDNKELDRWYADQNLGTSGINANSFTTRTVASGLYIEETDLIQLTGNQDGGDRAAIDYIQFIPVEQPTTPLPTPELRDIETALDENADVLRGGLGNDLIDGGTGNDILYGEDELNAEEGGSDSLYGGDGNDTLFGNAGDDALFGDYEVGIYGPQPESETPSETASSGNLIVEAEGFTLDGYLAETWQGGSGNQVIQTKTSGTATFDFTGTSGVYDMVVHGYDSNAGDSTFGVLLNGTTIDKWLMNQNTGATPIIEASRTLSGINLSTDDTIQLIGVARDTELAWIDYVEFIPTTSTVSTVTSDPRLATTSPTLLTSLALTDEKITDATASVASSGNDTLFGGRGNDTLHGGAGNDTLNGTDDVAIGVFEIDTLTGGDGADTFILGNARQSYYSAQGTSDYAIITDFHNTEDVIQLNGSSSDYTLQRQDNSVQVYRDSQELIAQLTVGESTSFNLDSSAFSYV